MNGHSVDIGVVHKPNDLVGEKLSVVLRGQVRLSGFTGVQLKAFPDSLSQHIQSRISFHDLCHGLLDEGFYTREPVTEGTARKGENNVSRSPIIERKKKQRRSSRNRLNQGIRGER